MNSVTKKLKIDRTFPLTCVPIRGWWCARAWSHCPRWHCSCGPAGTCRLRGPLPKCYTACSPSSRCPPSSPESPRRGDSDASRPRDSVSVAICRNCTASCPRSPWCPAPPGKRTLVRPFRDQLNRNAYAFSPGIRSPIVRCLRFYELAMFDIARRFKLFPRWFVRRTIQCFMDDWHACCRIGSNGDTVLSRSERASQ